MYEATTIDNPTMKKHATKKVKKFEAIDDEKEGEALEGGAAIEEAVEE